MPYKFSLPSRIYRKSVTHDVKTKWVIKIIFPIFILCSFNIFLPACSQKFMSLRVYSDFTITPSNTKAARPESLLLNNEIMLSYLQLLPRRTFRLIRFDKDLNLKGHQDLDSGENQPTDIRVCRGSNNSIVHVFETINFPKRGPNHLYIASYEVRDSIIENSNKPKMIGVSKPFIIPHLLPKPGDVILDDSPPYFYNDQIIVINRKWESAIIQVQFFSRDLKLIKKHNLDLRKFIPKSYIGKCCLIDMNERPYLVAMVYDGPPNGYNQSYSALFELDSKITSVENYQVLSKTSDYGGIVNCVRYNSGILYVASDILMPQSKHMGIIEAFSVKQGFQKVASIKVNEGVMVDNHFSFEILDKKIIVFYPIPGEEIRLKIISIN